MRRREQAPSAPFFFSRERHSPEWPTSRATLNKIPYFSIFHFQGLAIRVKFQCSVAATTRNTKHAPPPANAAAIGDAPVSAPQSAPPLPPAQPSRRCPTAAPVVPAPEKCPEPFPLPPPLRLSFRAAPPGTDESCNPAP